MVRIISQVARPVSLLEAGGRPAGQVAPRLVGTISEVEPVARTAGIAVRSNYLFRGITETAMVPAVRLLPSAYCRLLSPPAFPSGVIFFQPRMLVTGGSAFCRLNNQRETKKFGIKEAEKTEGGRR